MSATNKTPTPETDAERRQFLRRAGRFAAVTPPAITMMLAATTVPALAKASGHPNNGFGNGGGDGVPGKSGKEDSDR
jgi:hypothetical protein